VKCNVSKCISGRGRPKKSWNEVIRHDLDYWQLREDITGDRNLWKSRIKVGNQR